MDTQTAALPALIARQSTCHIQQRRIQEVAQAALLQSGYRAIAELRCEVNEDAIMLSGVVSTYYLKQLAQEVVLRLKFVHRIHNAVQVRSS